MEPDIAYLKYLNERDNIRKLQAEGIAAAKANVIRLGRELKLLSLDFSNVYKLWRKGTISAAEAAKCCGVARLLFAIRR